MSESPQHDCAALLAHADWVRALARHLAADAHTAEDLAQDALAAVLVRPPPAGLHLRAWLGGVLRNLVAAERRAAGHRGARERRAARGEAVASDALLLERLDSHRAVVEAVGRLDEPYRTAILLRYFEGLAPAAIAKRTGTPLRTVHTRLHRALARLRAELDRAHGGDRRAWLLALIPYARGSGGWSTAAGALVMDAKLKVGLAALCALFLCSTIVYWRIAPAAGAPPPPPAAAAVDAPRAGEPAGALAQAPAADERRALAAEAEAEAAPPAAVETPAPAPVLAGRVLDAEHGAVAGLRVRFAARGPSSGGDREAVSDASGAFALERPLSGGTLDVATPGWTALFRPEFSEAPGAREVVLVVARSATLGGRVVDEAGRPIESARVAVPLPFRLRARFEAILADASTVERATDTGPDGRFELEGVPIVADVELVTSRAAFLEDRRAPPAHDELGLEIVLRRAEQGPERLLGRVVDPSGDAVEGAWVALGQSSTMSAPDGRFALELAGAGDGAAEGVLRAVKAGYLPAEIPAAVLEPGAEPLVLRLGPPPPSIRGRVVDAAGEPVPGALVWTDEETHFGYIRPEGAELTVSMGATVEGILRGDPWTFRVRADAAGRFELAGLEVRNYRLRAFDPARAVLATASVAAGSENAELRLPDEGLHPRVAGRVTSLSGAPLAGVRVVLARPPLGRGPADILECLPARTDADGRFAFERVSRAVHAALVQGRELGLEGFEHLLGPGDDLERLELAVPLNVHAQVDAGEAAGFDRAALLDAQGEPLMLSVVHGEHAYGMDQVELDRGRSETFSVSELAATLVLFSQGVEARRVPVRLAHGELNTLRP